MSARSGTYTLGVTQWSLGWKGPAALERAAQLGFSAIHTDAGEPGSEFFVGDATTQRLYQQVSADTSVAVTGIGINVLCKYGIPTSARYSARSRYRQIVHGAIDGAAAMGAGLVWVPSFMNSEIRDQADLERTAAVLREACAYAEKTPVRVATENSLGLKENLELLRKVNHPKLCVLFDTLNPVMRGHSAVELVRGLWSHMCDQIHAKDGRDGGMGNAALNSGVAGFAETAVLLCALGFSGRIVLENDYCTDAETRVARDLAVIKECFDKECNQRSQ